jgi:hypothetical protein
MDYGHLTPILVEGIKELSLRSSGLQTLDSSVLTTPSIFVSSGNVGIGTTNPTEKLEIVDGNIQITNGTLLVDGVNLNDQILGLNLSVGENATTLESLNGLVNSQLSIISGSLNDLQIKDADLQLKIDAINSQIATLNTNSQILTALQSQVDEIKAQNETILSFLSVTDGKLDLMKGTLEAEGVVAGAFTVKVKPNGDSKTIGKYILCPPLTEVDSLGACSIAQVDTTPVDGKDDTTSNPLRDGKSVIVKTKVIKANSKVFITPKSAIDQPLAVTTIIPGESFTVEVKNPVLESMEFDWFVVGEQIVSEPL